MAQEGLQPTNFSVQQKYRLFMGQAGF